MKGSISCRERLEQRRLERLLQMEKRASLIPGFASY